MSGMQLRLLGLHNPRTLSEPPGACLSRLTVAAYLCCLPVNVADQCQVEQIEHCKYVLCTSNQNSSFGHMIQNGIDVHKPCRIPAYSSACDNRGVTTGV